MVTTEQPLGQNGQCCMLGIHEIWFVNPQQLSTLDVWLRRFSSKTDEGILV